MSEEKWPGIHFVGRLDAHKPSFSASDSTSKMDQAAGKGAGPRASGTSKSRVQIQGQFD